MLLEIGVCVVVIFILVWVYSLCITQHERSQYYQLALARSKATGRPLIVIGDPRKGISSQIFGVSYGYGDVCIDLEPLSKNCIASDATEYLSKLRSNSAVIFVSCVLEYVPDLDQLIAQLYRVSGNSNNLFIVAVKWYSIAAYWYKYENDTSCNLITSAPPSAPTITYRSL